MWWCELAGVRDPDALPEAVAAAVGYAPSQGVSLADGLAGFFRHKHLLLVLDNCEHLLSAVAGFVRAMSEEAPQFSVLVTSREALSIQGERTYPLAPLDLPVDASPSSVEQSAAGSLFADPRPRSARGTFTVTAENAAAIADLCGRLDGNALAIELAAARTTMMSPAEILVRLDQRFRLLIGRGRDVAERHQTLEAAIEWSYELLDTAEQSLLQRLAVFVGDFDLAAATAIAADVGLDEFDAVDRLGSLVAKSLVEHSDTASVSRYRLLETIRHYAAAQLDIQAAPTRARDAHASHYLAAGRDLFAMLSHARRLRRARATPGRHAEPGRRPALAPRHPTASPRSSVSSPTPDGSILVSCRTGCWTNSGVIADQALEREGVSEARGYVDGLFFAGIRAFVVGDWERYQEVASAGGTRRTPNRSPCSACPGAATMRADLETARSLSARPPSSEGERLATPDTWRS